MAHQSLYRRYRPRKFSELRGQEPVVGALQRAVAGGTEGHAYLFSGPRGTGKTSTARILAKALNCENLTDGEPCTECESCRSIEAGNSYDLFELDAASNNGVDAMRDLISRTVVGSPGRTKVYILDEVHMLSSAASNALLKTLEEPPDHVKFVLATTDPQKVLPTIRSRTQHFEFSLLSAAELTEYVRWIIADAGLDVDEEAIAYVVRKGRGSARDTLSELDMVVAAGGVTERGEPLEEILAALGDRDAGAVMRAVAEAVAQGREPRVLGEHLIGLLRDAFLASVHADLSHLSDADQQAMADVAKRLGAGTITRALESVGSALVDMRQAADPRIPLEVALLRLCEAGSNELAALQERVAKLEALIASGSVAATASAPSAPSPAAATAPATAAPSSAASQAPRPAAPQRAAAPDPSEYDDAEPGSAGGPSSAAEVRRQLASRRAGSASATSGGASAAPPPARGSSSAPSAPPAPGAPRPSAPPAPGKPSAPQRSDEPTASARPSVADAVNRAAQPAPPAPESAPAPAPAAGGTPSASSATSDVPPAPTTAGTALDVASVESAMNGPLLDQLRPVVRAVFREATVAGVSGSEITLALPAALHGRADGAKDALLGALAQQFGQVSVRFVDGAVAPRPAGSEPPRSKSAGPTVEYEDEEHVDVSALTNADVATTGIDKLVEAFPGAIVMEED